MTYLPKPKNICENCQKEYIKNHKYSLAQWSQTKYCSVICAAQVRRVRDGMTRGERFRRKNGSLKAGTPEWLEKIRARTTEAMYRPEVNAKLRQTRRPMSRYARIALSNRLAGIMPKNMMYNSNNYPNIQRGNYENSKGTMYFRSKWEANYALYLDFLVQKEEIKSWEYEVDTFIFEKIPFGTRSYTPDFKVFNHDDTFEYHEVKGYMDSKSKTKLRRMDKFFPDIKVILIDSVYYRDLYKKMNKILHFY